MWEHELALALAPDLAGPAPDFYDEATLSRINATSPHLIRAFARRNDGKSYREQVKPFNFLTTAPGARPPAGVDGEVRLIAPYGTTGRRATTWVDLRHPTTSYRLSTDPTQTGRATVASHGTNAGHYLAHREPKSCGPDGQPCDRQTTGLLRRRPVTVGTITVIGKEANRLDDREDGTLTLEDLDDYQTTYIPPKPRTQRPTAAVTRVFKDHAVPAVAAVRRECPGQLPGGRPCVR